MTPAFSVKYRATTAAGAPVRAAGAPPRPVRAVGERSYVIIDLIAAMSLTVVLVVVFAAAIRQVVASTEETDTRRLLRLAAETELSRLRVGLAMSSPGGAMLAQNTPRPPRDIIIETTTTAAHGQWSGLTLVTVAAKKQVRGGRWVHFELRGYLEATLEPKP